MVKELGCASELESYVDDSLAAARATHAGQISREVPGREENTGPSGWG
jgi:hypothetical protein